ncbi:MAG: zinc-finger domain-containing protein [Gammaproteobacteria bacterium]
MMKSATSVELIKANDKEAVCDGGGGTLGHPKVYLPFGKKSAVECYYCGKRFEKSLSNK